MVFNAKCEKVPQIILCVVGNRMHFDVCKGEIMPRFSIIIPSYNNADLLKQCLESLISQTFESWEAIVVVDASPDNSFDLAMDYASADPRIKPINKRENEGQHLARKTGMQYAQGEYSLLIDADDAICPTGLEELSKLADSHKKADMLHFGAKVLAANETPVKEADAFCSYMNREFDDLEGFDILAYPFDPRKGFTKDWMVTQRAYRTQLLKDAFDAMPYKRLDRAEDAYEYFVIASLATYEVTDPSVMVYLYNYGTGVTGFSKLGLDDFVESARRFKSCCDEMMDYACRAKNNDWIRCAYGAKHKCMDLLFNDWNLRLGESDKPVAARKMVSLFGDAEVASQVMRVARDLLYEGLMGNDASSRGDLGIDYYDLAETLLGEASDDPYANSMYRSMHAAATAHLNGFVRSKEAASARGSQPIRIFVSTHRDAAFFDSAILQPVQVGAQNASVRFPGMFHDDEGDNISELNSMYCELTTQYWAWKNVDAEYYGFCHYRRYFDFSSNRHTENAYGEIIEEYIDEANQRKYCLDDASIEKMVRQYDVITTEIKDLSKFPGDVGTPRAQYHAAPRLVDADLDRVIGILKEMHPEYSQDADAFLDGGLSCFCNMFIMRKDIFFDYCAWLFPILERFVAQTDMTLYSKEALRTPGHLSERLFNIYYQHHVRIGSGWKTKQLQCVRFECPERVYDLLPPGDSGLMPVIPVVFAADGNYVPMLTATIHSMLANASPDYYYDIVVLERGISGEDQRIMRQVYAKPGKVSLTFYNVGRIVESYDLATNNAHISIETYYRFLVQELLPHYDKVLYLDSDLIVQGDVSQLFETELGNNLLAAVRDLDFLGNINMKDGKRMQYAKTVLGMKDPYAYFQAGVLVLNTAAMRSFHGVEEWLKLAGDPRYIYNDQDILNAECEGRVHFLDYRWNVMTDCAGRIANVFSYAPNDVYEAFLESRKDQLITHYAGFEKPWKFKHCDRSALYWKYARQTPFYERLVRMFCGQAGDENYYDDHEYAIDKNNPMRRLIDPIMPYGSRRREVVKAAVRKVRGRK